ncbi:type I restriction-modification system subunit M [Immundisolibacter cernigliae]|uniref:site-specific DNA-methyltransferase (adenine-specific) n=1 Tax=Immundisolibacter cernigliae TaxID=1810504 RepID=A0A1B1YTU8_9GAMM|nr:type I restriction-modification system subunit M [Immundisolibacter cernigliae]ANX04290.1 type I restriction endonuclease subunit M [Immundisolibacter cernigliae]
MALKKSQLYSSLWQSCDELRGGMDASQYKDYVLTLLFMKYVSDKYAGKSDALIEVLPGGGFADMVKLKGDKEIGDRINKIIGRLAEANDLKGVIDQADFNDESKLGSGKEMQDRLSKLVAIFDGLDFRANRAEGDDLLGDAYEYLMRHFATDSGKSKGQFYTPAEVSRIMAQVVGIGADTRPDQTIYDPTCGSGSLLLKAADEAPRGISIYGQEMDVATWALARMNMILHGHPTAELWRGNTLASPHFKTWDDSLKTFDFAVANPPFSSKAWASGLDPANDAFGRFAYGIPPDKNGDYAFLLHLIASLKSSGKGAIILPHGVLFRGNREADIRRNLIQRGLIKGIIGLPANLFYGTGIPACIIVIDKAQAHVRTGIFMIDASKSFLKDGNKNRLRAQDIHKIVDVFNRQIELPRYSRMVPVSEIGSVANDYNLNLPRYIDASEPEDLHDLHAHLNGGIPNRDIDALGDYWAVFPALRKALFTDNGRAGYSEARIDTHQIKPAILEHGEFKTFAARVGAVFDGWRQAHQPQLLSLKIDDLPKTVIHCLSEDLLTRFSDLPLLSRYDVYQRLMDYWADVMQDDVYLIAADGWLEAAKPRGVVEDKDRKIKETPDLSIGRKKYKMDLLPPALIVARYFKEQQATLDALQAAQETAARELEEFVEQHVCEEGLLEDAVNDKGKVTKASIKSRLNELKAVIPAPTVIPAQAGIQEDQEEHDALTRCLQLIDAESDAGKAVKDAQAALDEKVLARYAKLSEAEIKTLVVEDKWFASLQAAIAGGVQRLTQQLAGRVKELEERYARPLPELERDVETFSVKVEEHLKQMGLAWA